MGENQEQQQWCILFQRDTPTGRQIDDFYGEPGASIARCIEIAEASAEARGTLIAVVRIADVAPFLGALRDHNGMGDLIRAVGKYAAAKGEAWRVGEGVEIMDAYQTVIPPTTSSSSAAMIRPSSARRRRPARSE